MNVKMWMNEGREFDCGECEYIIILQNMIRLIGIRIFFVSNSIVN